MKRPPKSAYPSPIKKCPECNREFDLRNEDDAQEWYYGHDCEAP